MRHMLLTVRFMLLKQNRGMHVPSPHLPVACMCFLFAPCCLCSSVSAMETVHKAQLENQQTIVVRFEALDKELVLVPVKVKTGTHKGWALRICCPLNSNFGCSGLGCISVQIVSCACVQCTHWCCFQAFFLLSVLSYVALNMLGHAVHCAPSAAGVGPAKLGWHSSG